MQGHLQVLLDEVGAAAHTTEQENLALLADIDALGQSARSGWTKWRSCAPSAPTIWQR